MKILTKVSLLKNRIFNITDEDQLIATKKHKKVIDLENDELMVFFEKFRKKLYGHSKFKNDFEEQVRTFKIFNKLGEHKVLSLF